MPWGGYAPECRTSYRLRGGPSSTDDNGIELAFDAQRLGHFELQRCAGHPACDTINALTGVTFRAEPSGRTSKCGRRKIGVVVRLACGRSAQGDLVDTAAGAACLTFVIELGFRRADASVALVGEAIQ